MALIMRSVRVEPKFAQLLGRLRQAAKQKASGLCSGNFGRSPSEGRVRLQDVEHIEKLFDMALPDPIIAYIAAGVSAWGDGPLSIAGIEERTLIIQDHHDANEYSPGTPFVVVDDDSNGNYIAVRKDDAGFCFLDHETGFELDGRDSLAEHIEKVLHDLELGGAQPFAVELVDSPDPEPVVMRVSHPKFGEGKVVQRLGDNVTVDFESVGEKRLKASFLTFLDG